MTNKLRNHWIRFGSYGILSLFCVHLSACSWRAPQAPKVLTKPVQGGVSFSDVVLAQTDVKGKLLWKFQAKGVTSKEGQAAAAQSIKGQLYEAGKPVFDIAAGQGSIRQTNQQVNLQGNIQVTDRQNRVVFRGREAQWNPQTGRLVVRSGLTVTHPQLRLWANELQASKQGKVILVKGSVVMETRGTGDQKDAQRLRLKANQAVWNVEQQSFQAGTALENGQQPTVEIEQLSRPTAEKAVALAGEAKADLKRGVVELRSPVRLTLGALMLTSRELRWETLRGRISTRELLQLQDPRRQVTVLANAGSVEQARNLVDLQGKVEVTGLKDRARLTSDQLLWNTKTERIEALGNVNYVQESPAFTLRGPRAVGKLEAQTLRISGGDVVTEILP